MHTGGREVSTGRHVCSGIPSRPSGAHTSHTQGKGFDHFKEVSVKNLNKRLAVLMVLVLVVAFAALVLAACGSSGSSGSTTSSEGTPKAGGTYNWPLDSNPVAIDPLNAYESVGMQVVHQAFQGLMGFKLNAQGGMDAVPVIAESYTQNADATVFTFKLKHGVTFAPPVSREVKAQDFVDSFNYVTDPNNGSPVSYVLAPIQGCNDSGYQSDPKKGLTGVKALDDFTLQITLRYPFAEFVQTLGHPVASVQPMDYIQKVGKKAFEKKPVGTGPYQVTDWVPNQKIDMAKNPSYWDKSSAGYVDTIHMPVITELSTQWLEFQKGTIDYTSIPPGQEQSSKTNPKVTSGEWTWKTWPELAVYYVSFNMNDPVVGGTQGLELRKAIYEATNPQDVINIAKAGIGLPATGPVPVGIPGYQPNVSPYSFNEADSKAILAKIGNPGTLNYWYNTDEGHQKVAEVLQAGWKTVGLNFKLNNFEWPTFLDKTSKGEGQVYRAGWIADYPSMDNFLYPLFESHQPSYNNSGFYKNPQFDALLKQARQTTDQTQRYNLYIQAEKVLMTDAAIVPLYYYQSLRVTNNRIGGFVYDPMGFVDMWKLWVK